MIYTKRNTITHTYTEAVSVTYIVREVFLQHTNDDDEEVSEDNAKYDDVRRGYICDFLHQTNKRYKIIGYERFTHTHTHHKTRTVQHWKCSVATYTHSHTFIIKIGKTKYYPKVIAIGYWASIGEIEKTV